jgi:hypothetical protein
LPRSATRCATDPSDLERLHRPALRSLLSEALRSDSDLDAFCSDYFPGVYKRFTRGMDRTEKLTTLLDHADPAEILEALRKGHPNAVLAPAPKPESLAKPENSPAHPSAPAGSPLPARPRWMAPATAAAAALLVGAAGLVDCPRCIGTLRSTSVTHCYGKRQSSPSAIPRCGERHRE